MAGVILDTGDPVILRFGLSVDYTLRLYTNTLDPATTSVIGNFTECTDPDYAPITLTGGAWTVTTEANEGKGSYAQQAFIFDSGLTQQVHGYYIERGGAAIAAERFEDSGGTAAPIATGTSVIYVGPVIRSNNRAS